MSHFTVVGTTLSALVTADALAGAGHSVTLYATGGPLGAGFAGVPVDGRVTDVGIRVLEFDLEGVGEASPLSEYDAASGDLRPFLPHARAWADELAGDLLHVQSEQHAWSNGTLSKDFYYSVDLTRIAELVTPEQLRAIVEETAALPARGWIDSVPEADREHLTLREASLRSHGQTFHDALIEPFVRKITEVGTDGILATYTRKVWAPLLWPSTIHQAALGEPLSFTPHRPLESVPGGVAAFVGLLVERMKARGVTVVEAGGLRAVDIEPSGEVTCTFANIDPVTDPSPVIAVSPASYFAARGQSWTPTTARTVVCWAELPAEDVLFVPSLIHVLDPALRIARVTAPGPHLPGKVLLTVELHHDTEEEDAPAALAELEQMGVIRPGARPEVLAIKSFQGLVLASPANYESFLKAQSGIEGHGNAHVLGGALGFGSSSINDHILQGLGAAEVLLG